MNNKIRIKAHDAQLEFLDLDERFVGFIGGIGSGKTVAGAMWTLYKVIKKPKMNGIVATRTFPMLRDVIIPAILDVTPEAMIKQYNRVESTIEFTNGSKIFFRPLENEHMVNRLRGYTVNWVWVDEAAYISYYAIEVLNGRMRQGTDQQMAITGTPKGMNWVYEQFEEPRQRIPHLERKLSKRELSPVEKDQIKAEIRDLDERRKQWKAVMSVTSSDNPFLPTEYIESIKAQYTGEYYAQEIEGQFVKFQGLIYKEFNRHKHVLPLAAIKTIKDEVGFREFIFGYDAGFNNPRVIVKVAKTNDDRFIVTNEWYRVETLVKDAIAELSDLGAADWILWGDPSAKTELEEIRGAGFTARPADNAVIAGIQYKKQLLQEDRLLISETCQNMINEFGTYQWKGEPDKPKEEPIKKDDHAMDALRYALYSDKGTEIPFGTL